MPANETVLERLIYLVLMALVLMARGLWALAYWVWHELEQYATDGRGWRS